MKICFFAAANSLHSHRWVNYFVDKGHDISWISLSETNETLKKVEFYDIGPLSTKPLTFIRQIIRFRKLIKQIKPDLLHIHSVGTYGIIGVLSGFTNIVATAWGSDVLFASQFFIKRQLIKYTLKKAKLITCDADHMIVAMTKLGIGHEKIKLIYFGIEPEKFNPGPKDSNIQEQWNSKNSAVIISLRNLESIYDIETLIKSVPAVLKKIQKIKVIIAGTGPQEDYLKKVSAKLGLERYIKFIGRYSHQDLPRILRSSDIYVSTSLSDAGIAASTAEAMAIGLPVIITDSGENRKWVSNEINGLIFPVKDSALLAEKIIDLCLNNEKREKIGREGQKNIRLKNNYYIEMEKMMNLYESLG
ncbi:MAG: glycosyltransferase family 4 protein [Pseudomonadota bacterium]